MSLMDGMLPFRAPRLEQAARTAAVSVGQLVLPTQSDLQRFSLAACCLDQTCRDFAYLLLPFLAA
jgi:hypothetical protein